MQGGQWALEELWGGLFWKCGPGHVLKAVCVGVRHAAEQPIVLGRNRASKGCPDVGLASSARWAFDRN